MDFYDFLAMNRMNYEFKPERGHTVLKVYLNGECIFSGNVFRNTNSGIEKAKEEFLLSQRS